MKILFLSKKTNWCDKAIKYTLEKFDDVTVFQGGWEDKIPDEVRKWKGEMIISYLSPWIVPEKLLKNVNKAINFHPGTPEYAGIGCYNFAIYNQENKYGVLCHEMQKKVDSGKIIKLKMFPVTQNETVESLKEKSMTHMLSLFYEIIDLIKNEQTLPISKYQWNKKPYTRKDLQNLCRITLDIPKNEILKRLRATYYPGGPDYPYIKINSKRIILKEIYFDGLENTPI